jgi:trk system potassium uptake protein TrkH
MAGGVIAPKFSILSRRFAAPSVVVLGAFGSLITIGSILLWLPVSHADDTVGLSDAVFTATSAVTVTGLVVVDTGTAWSAFGELVILALIQIGGLGIMTLAGFVGIAINRRLGVGPAARAAAEIGLSDLGVLRYLIRDLVRFVFIVESIVAVVLTIRFWVDADVGVVRAVHLGLFHSVSAFNNAGFSIFDGGLAGYVDDWFVSLVIAGTFILGGIGFPVVFELARRWRRPTTWSLHSRVTLSATALLLLGGTVVISLVEWSNDDTLGSLGVGDRVLAAFFQSATARTAGFNTLDIGALRPATWLALAFLMVIGAGSASTGGGIKVSTVAVVVRSTLAEFRRDRSVHLHGRNIPAGLQREALALVIAAVSTVGAGTFLLVALEPDIGIGRLLFEAASAFGTTGLSTGVTETLSGLSRLVIVALMFIGRVGPITFGTAVLLRTQARAFRYPDGNLIVG